MAPPLSLPPMLKRLLRSLGMTSQLSAAEVVPAASPLWQACRARWPSYDEEKDPQRRFHLCLAHEVLELDTSSPPSEGSLPAVGRACAQLLVDNDRLPPVMQLRREDLDGPLRLLRAFYQGHDNVQEEAKGLLHDVEDRFDKHAFGQARLLLNLFDTEPRIRRQNEINLFYESMVLRHLGSRKRKADTPAKDKLQQAWQSAAAEGLRGLPGVLFRLEQDFGVHFHLRGRDQDEAKAWEAATGLTLQSTPLLRELCDKKWRPALSQKDPASLETRLREHVGSLTLQDACASLTRNHFFLARTSGRIGLEPVLYHYMRWLEEHYEGSPIQVLPGINFGVLRTEERLDHIIADLCDLHLRPKEGATSPSVSLDEAVRDLFTQIVAGPIEEVPEGCYDLGGMVFERMMGYAPAMPVATLRQHRLT